MTGAHRVRAVLEAAMAADGGVHLLGEAIALSPVGAPLLARFPRQVHLLPASDATLAGVAVGIAMAGGRAVVELAGPEGLWGALQQLGQEASTLLRGEHRGSVVVRAPLAPGAADCAALVLGAPDVALACGATGGDAAMLLEDALRRPGVTVLLEPLAMLAAIDGAPGPTLPLGAARQLREGADATVLAFGAAVAAATHAADSLAASGIAVDLYDLRSLRPLDTGRLTASVARTGRCVVVGASDQALLAAIQEAFLRLEAPPMAAAADSAAVAAAVRAALDW